MRNTIPYVQTKTVQEQMLCLSVRTLRWETVKKVNPDPHKKVGCDKEGCA